MPGRVIPRQSSLILPDIENPFVHKIQLTQAQKIQVALMTIFVFPIRVAGIVFCLLVAWVLASIALRGRTEEQLKEPLTGWRKALRGPFTALGRLYFFFFGFQWINIKGTRLPREQAPVLVVAPHSSFFDVFAVFMMGLPSAISRIENSRPPIFGTLTSFSQPVFVTREDPNSRQNTIKEIRRRAHSDGKWPHVVIFPEGTCTNRKCLISFKPGGFYPGVPVQPVLIRYHSPLDTYTWAWEGPGALTLMWLTLCQFNNSMEIEYLPVYMPSDEEKEDARLYASNVRAHMAKALGIPTTDHTYEDIRLMHYAVKLDLPETAGLVEFAKLSKKLGINFDNIKSLLDDFCKMAQKGSGQVSLEQFAAHLNLPISEPLREVFELYDRNGSGTIDFREYVIGLSVVSIPANTEDTLRLAFQAFDQGGKGYINEAELAEILQRAFGMSDVDVHQLFVQVDADQDGKINYGEFKEYAKKIPEYAKLFTTYQELMQEEEDDGSYDTASESSSFTDVKATESVTDASKVKSE